MISHPIIWNFFHVEIEKSTQSKIFQWITLMKGMLNTLLPMEGNDSEPDHNISALLFWMSNPQSHVWICTKSLWLNRPPFSTSFPKRQRGSVLFYLPWLNVAIHPVSIPNIYLSVRKTIFGQKIDLFEPVQIGDHRPEQWGMRFEIQRSKDLFQSVTWSQRFELIFIFASLKLLASLLSILV